MQSTEFYSDIVEAYSYEPQSLQRELSRDFEQCTRSKSFQSLHKLRHEAFSGSDDSVSSISRRSSTLGEIMRKNSSSNSDIFSELHVAKTRVAMMKMQPPKRTSLLSAITIPDQRRHEEVIMTPTSQFIGPLRRYLEHLQTFFTATKPGDEVAFQDTENIFVPLRIKLGHWLYVIQEVQDKRYKNEDKSFVYRPWFLYSVSLIQIIFFILTLIQSRGFAPLSVNPLFGPHFEIFLSMGGNIPSLVRKDWETQAWRLVSPLLLHGGILHLLTNVYSQIIIGRRLEASWGPWRIAVIYYLSSLGGHICGAVIRSHDLITVGASGGVLGLLGTILADSVENYEAIWRPKVQAGYWMFNTIVLLLTGLAPMMDNIVHVGGFVTGVFAGFLFIPTLTGHWKRRMVLLIVGLSGTLFIIHIIEQL
ncbi:rhomboid family-domain-containing protein [Paraphysoderma sedebokerense]|nr:rhomboid family-domain-containing protein [Paraphysoderma sedebokerense]